MSKRPVIDVDEDMIRDTMLDIPRRRPFAEIAPPKGETISDMPAPTTPPIQVARAEPEREPVRASPAAHAEPKESESARRGPYRKKKPQEEEEQPYCGRFLVNDGVRSRVTTAIDRDIHKKMKKLLVLVAPDVTIVSYISNVLAHHLELFRDEIDELYRRETEKPL